MNKGFLIVEGHGELDAARLLIGRLWRDLALPDIYWEKPIRAARGSLHHRITVERMCELLRSQRRCDAALILRDADNNEDCPATNGPLTASWIAALNLPFPTAVVLARREFEAWFLPCMKSMTGKKIRDGLQLQTTPTWTGDPEEVRGAKAELTRNLFPKNKPYKESVDQAALVQMVDFSLLRSANVRSFGTLERALKFLAAPNDSNVYPPPVLPTQPQTTAAKKRKK
jgi:hypothetical protein